MAKEIVNLKELARLCGRSRIRVTALVGQGRIQPDYIDNEGHRYWSRANATRIAEAITEHEASARAGRNASIEFPRKRQSRKAESEE